MNKAFETDSPDKMTVSTGPGAGVASPTAISTATCKVNEHCVGDHWTVGDFELLARLIAIIAMGHPSFRLNSKRGAPDLGHQTIHEGIDPGRPDCAGV